MLVLQAQISQHKAVVNTFPFASFIAHNVRLSRWENNEAKGAERGLQRLTLTNKQIFKGMRQDGTKEGEREREREMVLVVFF